MARLVFLIISILFVAISALTWFALKNSEDGPAEQAHYFYEQGRQILGAMHAYEVAHGRWPQSLEQMAQAKFLPRTFEDAEGNGVAWSMPVAQAPVLVLRRVLQEEACRAFNGHARAVDGIALKAYSRLGAQCYGGSQEQLRIVISKPGTDLSEALPPGHASASEPVVKPSVAGWWRAPRTADLEAAGAAAVPDVSEAAPEAGATASTEPALRFEPVFAFERSLPQQPLTVLNDRNGAITLLKIQREGDESFEVEAGTCTAPLAPGASCELQAFFSPTHIGELSATLRLAFSGREPMVRTLVGSAHAPRNAGAGPSLQGIRLDRGRLRLSDTPPGMASEPAAGLLRLTNVSEDSHALPSVELFDNAHFAVDDADCRRAAPNGTLPSAGSCLLVFSFFPAQAGMYSTAVRMRAGSAEVLVPLQAAAAVDAAKGGAAFETHFNGQGTGVTQVDLGVQAGALGRAGRFEPVAFEVRNTGRQPLVFSAMTVSGGDKGFVIDQVPKGAERSCLRVRLEPDATCELHVGYELTDKAGRVNATADVVFRDPQGVEVSRQIGLTAKTHEAWLTLTEVQSGLELGSGSAAGKSAWNFGQVRFGEAPTKKYLLRNRGAAPVKLAQVQVQPFVVRPDSEARLACGAHTTLAPGQDCPITLTFAPRLEHKPGERVHFSIQVQTEQKTAGDDPFSGLPSNTLGWTAFGLVR